jgi:hypothetical protein
MIPQENGLVLHQVLWARQNADRQDLSPQTKAVIQILKARIPRGGEVETNWKEETTRTETGAKNLRATIETQGLAAKTDPCETGATEAWSITLQKGFLDFLE